MAITIDSEPEVVSPVENMISLELTSDNFILDAGEYFDLLLRFDSKFILNETLTLNIDGVNYVFTALVAPDTLGNSIPEGTPYASIDLWVKAVVTAINRNPFISINYIVQSDDTDKIHFIAREKGNTWNITWSSNNADVFEDSETLGLNVVNRTDLKLVMNLYYQPVFNAEPLHEEFVYFDTLELPPNDSGKAIFYLQRLLKRIFALGEDDIPNFANAGLTLCVNTIKQYYFSIGEKYGTPVINYAFTESAFKLALNGGFSLRTAANQPLYTDIIETQEKFFNLHPLVKYITATQHEYLYYYHRYTFADKGKFTVRVNVYDNEGKLSDAGTRTYVEKATPKQHELHYFPIAYEDVFAVYDGLDQFNGEISKYEVWVEDSTGDPITETRTFIVDYTNQLYEREFCFRNPFGCYEFIVLHGKKEKGMLTKKALFSSVLTPGYSAESPQVKVTTTTVQQSDVVGGRMRSKDTAEWFMGFLNSKDVREVVNEKYIPVIINNKDDQVWKDAVNLNEFSLNIKGAFNNENLTDVAD